MVSGRQTWSRSIRHGLVAVTLLQLIEKHCRRRLRIGSPLGALGVLQGECDRRAYQCRKASGRNKEFRAEMTKSAGLATKTSGNPLALSIVIDSGPDFIL